MTRRISVDSYGKLCLGALSSLFVIVVSGGLVRLTGSGLGCSDWPACSEERFIDVSSTHGAIEQINRLFTGVVAALVIAAVMGSLFLQPRRKNVVWLSAGLVAGVLAQIILGAIVVLTGLNPFANMGHFLLSMVLLMNALILYRTVRPEGNELRQNKLGNNNTAYVKRLVIAIAVLGAASVVTGTVVTATGPHAGDEDAIRFGFAISSVARVHSITVIATLISILGLLVLTRRVSEFRHAIETKVGTLLGFALLQALVGYVQYFNGIPVFLVALHLAGAAAVWLCLVDLVIAVRARL